MSRVLNRRGFVAGSGSLGLLAASPAVAQETVDPRFSELVEALKQAVARRAAPWAVLSVTRRDGEVFRHAVGVGANHVAPLRSATKLATVTAVLTLVQDGRLSLDRPVERFVPAFVKDKSAITVRHLLSMSSGLPPAFRGVSDSDSLEEAVDRIARVPLLAAPGSRFIYGNLGLTVAGRVAEVVSGLPWEQFFQQALAGPLGLRFRYAPIVTGRLGGGGVTGVDSYVRLLRLHLGEGMFGGRRLLSSDLVAAMQAANGAAFRNVVPGFNARGYGLGWWLDEVDPTGAPVIVSCPGAAGAYPWLDRSRGYAAFLSVERSLGAGVALQRRMRPLVERALDART